MVEITDVLLSYDVDKNGAYIITGVEYTDSDKVEKTHRELVNKEKAFFELRDLFDYVVEKLGVDPEIVRLDEPDSD